MSAEKIAYAVADGVATITLIDPPAANLEKRKPDFHGR